MNSWFTTHQDTILLLVSLATLGFTFAGLVTSLIGSWRLSVVMWSAAFLCQWIQTFILRRKLRATEVTS